MSEYIGSRIALISKSDIKYIGTLHEINSESSTVALENVRSFGTEGRRNGQDEVPASDTIYEYIVFRGSDVKELSIVEAPKENKTPAAVPNDPAILGSARPAQYQQPPPPQQQQQPPPPHQNHFPGPQYPPQFDYQHGPPQQYPPQSRFQGPGGPHGFPGQPGAVPGYNPAFGPPPPHFGGPGYGPPPGAFGQHPPQGQFPPQNPIGPPGHRPQQDQPPRAPQKPAEMSGTPAPAAVAAGQQPPPPPLESKPSAAAQAAATAAATQPEAKPAPRKAPNNRVAVPLPAAAKAPPKPLETKPAPPAQPASYADATSAATAAVAEAMAKLNTGDATPSDNLANKVNQLRAQDGQRGRGRGRGLGAPRGGRRDLQRGVDVPKEDFDFQQSNAKFNKEDLVKEAIATGSPSAHIEQENPLENGNAVEDDIVIPPAPTEKGYNKQTSFFDNISSDLKDRSGAPTFDGRIMRREERSKNLETFGQGSVDAGHRGGFRGRGRGRGRGQGFGRGRGRGPAETAAVLAATS